MPLEYMETEKCVTQFNCRRICKPRVGSPSGLAVHRRPSRSTLSTCVHGFEGGHRNVQGIHPKPLRSILNLARG